MDNRAWPVDGGGEGGGGGKGAYRIPGTWPGSARPGQTRSGLPVCFLQVSSDPFELSESLSPRGVPKTGKLQYVVHTFVDRISSAVDTEPGSSKQSLSLSLSFFSFFFPFSFSFFFYKIFLRSASALNLETQNQVIGELLFQKKGKTNILDVERRNVKDSIVVWVDTRQKGKGKRQGVREYEKQQRSDRRQSGRAARKWSKDLPPTP